MIVNQTPYATSTFALERQEVKRPLKGIEHYQDEIGRRLKMDEERLLEMAESYIQSSESESETEQAESSNQGGEAELPLEKRRKSA
jgi:hypothetical protein